MPKPDAAAETRDPAVAARETFLALEDDYLDLQGDDTDGAASMRSRLRAKLRRATHVETCGPDCILVEMEIPAAVDGTIFKINNREYQPGLHQLYACEARQLAYMIDKNRRNDAARMRERGRNFNAGEIRARAIRSET